MGGKPTARRSLPRGVEIREGSKRDTLRITFYFRGNRCREPIDIEANASNIRYAGNLISEIENAIARQTFDYRAYFPNSKRATTLGIPMVSDIQIGSMLKSYLADEKKKGVLSPSTIRGYEEVTNAHLEPMFGKVQVKHLTPAMIRSWLATLNHLTIKRIKNILCPLSNILKQSVTDGLIDFNPLDRIVLAKAVPQTKESDYEVDPFDEEEVAAILQACPTIEERAFWGFAFSSGLRTSELIALSWANIDWNKEEFAVTGAKVDGYDGAVEKKTTKTKKSKRILPLLPGAMAALEAIKPITYMVQGSIFICPWTGDQWISDKQVRESSWRRVIRRAGVRYRVPYQTRHTFASILLSRGEDERLVAELLGHTTTEMVRRIYGKWIKTKSKRPRADYSDFASQKFGADLGQLSTANASLNQPNSKATKTKKIA